MLWQRSLFLSCLSMACFAILAGCSGDDTPGRPAIVPVKGTVVYKGDPVAGAQVSFYGPESPMPAIVTTDEQGAFDFPALGAADGLVPGENIVTVTKDEGGGGPAPMNPSMITGETTGGDLSIAPQIPSGSSGTGTGGIPQKYSNPVSSPLKIIISESGEKDLMIELVD